MGVASLELGEWDNLDLAWIELYVHPEHRRRGHGSAFLAHLLELAREAGRTKFGVSGWELPATVAFARHHGFKRASEEIYRVVRPRELPRGFVDERTPRRRRTPRTTSCSASTARLPTSSWSPSPS